MLLVDRTFKLCEPSVANFLRSLKKIQIYHQHHTPSSSSSFKHSFAFCTASSNPALLPSASASSNRLLASAKSPPMRAIIPQLFIATAQPSSHSTVRSGGCMDAATVIALWAHSVALARRAAGDVGGADAVGGGFWRARHMERLFT